MLSAFFFFFNGYLLENICPQVAFVLLTRHGLLRSLLAQTQFMMSRRAIFKTAKLVAACPSCQMGCFRYFKGKTKMTVLFSLLQQKNFSCTGIPSTSKLSAYF